MSMTHGHEDVRDAGAGVQSGRDDSGHGGPALKDPHVAVEQQVKREHLTERLGRNLRLCKIISKQFN